MNIDELIELRQKGVIDKMYRAGFLPPRVYMMIEANIKVRTLMRSGSSRGQAVKHTAYLFGVTPKCIYSYLKPFTS